MRLILIKERDPDNRFDNTDVQISAEVTTLDEAQAAFEDFLRGCGFAWDDSEDE